MLSVIPMRFAGVWGACAGLRKKAAAAGADGRGAAVAGIAAAPPRLAAGGWRMAAGGWRMAASLGPARTAFSGLPRTAGAGTYFLSGCNSDKTLHTPSECSEGAEVLVPH